MCFMSAGCGGLRARGTQGWLQSVAKRQGPVWICEVEEKNDALSCEVKTSSPVSSSPPRFSGTTHFAPGRWIGVELEDARGKNDGSVGGKEYFSCPDNRGLFVRSTQVQVREEGEAKTLTHSSSVSFLTGGHAKPKHLSAGSAHHWFVTTERVIRRQEVSRILSPSEGIVWPPLLPPSLLPSLSLSFYSLLTVCS